MAYRKRSRSRKGGTRKGFLGRLLGLAMSPIGWVAMAVGAVLVFVIGGKVKTTIEGIASKVNPMASKSTPK